MTIAALEKKRVRKKFKQWRDEIARTSKRQADYRMAIINLVLEHAFDDGELKHNHARRIKKLYKSDRSKIIWLDENIEVFCGPGCSDVLRFGCLLDGMTGLRLTDLVTIPLSADKGSHLEWTTSKSGETFEIVIPIYDELRSLLNSMQAYRRRHNVLATTILFNQRGRPYTASGFSASFRKRKKKVGIGKRLHLHDLRGTAALIFIRPALRPTKLPTSLAGQQRR